MGYLSKVLIGAVVGIGSVAAVPFTGGGSIFAGASLASSLTGAGLLATGAGLAGAGVGAKVQDVQNELEEQKLKAQRSEGFRDGVKSGEADAVSEVKKFVDFYLATTALSYYVARCDGTISESEQLELDYDLDTIKKNHAIPEQVVNEMKKIANNTKLTFDEVKNYLNKVDIETLRNLSQDIDEIVRADEVITSEELAVKEEFASYLKERESNEQSSEIEKSESEK